VTELKTKPTNRSINDFLGSIKDAEIREDCRLLVDIMKKATKAPPRIWGSGLVGFGDYHYKYASGREADWMLAAFAPRKQKITLYVMSGFEGYGDLLAKLGKHSHGKACLHIRRLSDVHLPTLKKLVTSSVKHVKAVYHKAS
jgi:hypothetical protein